MSSSKITLIGMYNYDNTIFDNLTFPPGVDKSLAVNEILMECGEFEILYPDLDFLKYQITKWGSKHYFTFEKWLKALAEEFNPIHNYDRYESYTDSHTGSGKQIDSEKREDKNNRARSSEASSEHSEDNNGNIISSSTVDQSEDKTSNSLTSARTDHSEDKTNNSLTSSQTDHSEEKLSDSTGASFTDTHSNTDDDVKRNVSAYDSSLYQPKEQEVTDGETSGNGSGTSMSHVKDETSVNGSEASMSCVKDETEISDVNNNLNHTEDSTNSNGSNNTITQSLNNMDAADSDKQNEFESGSSSGTADRQSEHQNMDINKHEAHLFGNIGITTSITMLREFTGFYKDFNLYEQIASLFVDEFCIRIY